MYGYSSLNDSSAITAQIENEFDCFAVSEYEQIIPTRGASFSLDVYNAIPSEHALLSTDLIKTLTADGANGDQFAQVFRASKDNIHDIQVALAGSGLEPELLDDFEYNSDSALRSVYSTSSTSHFQIYRNTQNHYTGSASLKLSIRRNTAVDETVKRDFSSPVDWSTREGLTFHWACSQNSLKVLLRLELYDSSNTAYLDFSVKDTNTWEECFAKFSSFQDIALIDLSDIRGIRIRCILANSTATAYFDTLYVYGGEDICDVNVTLYDLGSDVSSLASLPSPMEISSGVTSFPFEVSGGKRLQVLDLYENVGSSGILPLTIGNYYAFCISKPSYGSLNIYGSSSKEYRSADCYEVAADGSLTALSASSGFLIQSVDESRLSNLQIIAEGDPSNSTALITAYDTLTQKSQVYAEVKLGVDGYALDLKEILPEYIPLNKTTHLRIYYSDSDESRASSIKIRSKCYYLNFDLYG